MARRLNADDPEFAEAYAALLAERGERLDAAEATVRPLLADIRARGVEAVLEAAARFDGMRLAAGDLRVPTSEIDAAFAVCPPALIEALELAAARISDFHERQRPQDALFTDAQGVRLGWRWSPVATVGLYAPGGLAAYPSAVLMNAIPARIAGARRIVMATPPGRLNANPAVLAAARIAGVQEIYRVGGAQAIGALAYGAGPIPACSVIVGPGNAYVTAAKRLVYGDVGIDSIAGPSEVFILADGSTPPAWIAADLLAQAEHDLDAQSVLFCADGAYADAVEAEVEAALAAGHAADSAGASWRDHGAIVLVSRLEDAVALVNQAAPEHVQIAAAAPEALAALVEDAGAIFLGSHAPEALGDYIAGPNHVLPTGRRARFSSGLSTLTFMKRTTLVGADPAALAAIGHRAAVIADHEGLPAHARSLRLRLQSSEGGA